jgi:plastocyanin
MLPRFLFAALACVFTLTVHAQQQEVIATVTDQHGKPLPDAVVVAVPVDGAVRLPAKPRDAAIFQVDKEFTPKVSVVLAGTAISFPNNDSVRHHVYSFSAVKKFELPLYKGVPASPVVFDKPGIVVLGCNIHDWMVAYVYVSESPHFARTDAQGTATIGDLAAKGWTVRVWHPQLEGTEAQTSRTVDLAKQRRVEVAWTLAIKPEARVRRAPASRHSGSY